MSAEEHAERIRWMTARGEHVLADQLVVADTYWKRLCGLQFRSGMADGEALWLKDCVSIHTAWMRFAIDVFFLDESLRVVDIRRGVQPWRIARTKSKSARHVIEAKSLSNSTMITEGLETVIKPIS
ncbi:DUF192 domain-containing protein [Rhodopirellula sp. MGV]|uniref:DUF192 domain-containing protein n=1 Tax=Rhodopirellula sp. MGV TaxID=2023130 RepID=UPI000B96DCB3|nr:DUF192 domain-containing protein [Rhodopirellula sp. MGV]OYP32323.1 hypothetical protein CGZ80_19850 [Rhodopirellula sp. MGV]PNY35893.1 DUF192 domain-containing protein [Rhodopirellula baltica]